MKKLFITGCLALSLTACNSLSLAADREFMTAEISAFYDNPNATSEQCKALSEKIISYGTERQLQLLYKSVIMDCSNAGKMSSAYRNTAKAAALRLLKNATE